MSDEESFVPDFRYDLKQLADDWRDCIKCELGQRRATLQRPVVVGEGSEGGIMFIGEGPGGTEEGTGRPFVGASGQLLRKTLGMLHLRHDSYITNIVTCRSCTERLDATGQVRFKRKSKFSDEPPEIDWEDLPPTVVHMKACAPRIYQEIYKVDPVVIVTLGATATEFLTGSSISITKESGWGHTRVIQIPGATYVPNLTAKKGAWTRKVKEVVTLPVLQRKVEYLCVPCVHPAYVLRSLRDSEFNLEDAPSFQMYKTIEFAKAIYKRHQIEKNGEYSPKGAGYVGEEEDDC